MELVIKNEKLLAHFEAERSSPMQQSMDEKRAGNQNAHARYLIQYNKAMRCGFYLEAIMIDYAMMEDRLVALLHYLGFVTRTHEKLAVNKFCRADVRRLLGYKENVGIKITNISIKVKLLESLMNTDDPEESQFISAVRVHIDSNTKRDEISLLCEDIIMWSNIRNQYVHALLGKNYEALQEGLHGYFLMNMQFSVNFAVNSIAGIKLNTFPPVFESNPLLLCKFKLKEILYVICHEIDHIVLNHPAEMVKANPTKDEQTFYEFNLAADASVNDRINHEIKAENRAFLSAPDGLITSTALKKMYDLKYIIPMENYAYYFKLISGKKGKDEQAGNGQNSMMQQQNQKDGTEQSGQGAAPGQGDAEDSQDVVTAANCGQLSDHNWDAGDDAEDAQAVVREFVNSAVDMMNEESRGLMPAHFMSQVELINKPPVLSWQAILKKYIGTISANKRKTRMRLNRRQPERFDLSGSVDDKVLKIAVAIDTSGSVDDHMISQIFNEIFAILAKRKHEITVIECDAQVQRVYRAKNAGEIQKKVAGRGGTMFTPVIEYINKDKYFRDALLIYFTDGFGEHKIPKPMTYRNLWVVFGDERHLSVKEPYGVVLKL